MKKIRGEERKMNEIILKETNGEVLASSRDVADKFGKEPRNVMRDIRTLIKKHPEFGDIFFDSEWECEDNKQKYKEYLITEDGLEILESKYKFNVRSARFETKFGNELTDYLNQLGYEMITQYPVLDNKYRIDFYLLEFNIAIEYDEYYHKCQTQRDKARQTEIHNELGCEFIRIKEDMSVGMALGIISKKIFCKVA